MKNYLAIIPARYASTRFPGKPLAKIHGKPMIEHVFERTKAFFEHVFVATEDNRIYDTVKSFNGNVVMTSENHESGTDRCFEALSHITQKTGVNFDIVVNVQGDEPYIEEEQLQLLSSCFKDDGVQISTLIKPIDKLSDLLDSNKPKVVINKESEAIYFSRSPIPYYRGVEESKWLANHTYYQHIGLYAYRTDVLQAITLLDKGKLEQAESLEQLRWIENGFNITIRITDIENRSVDIPADLSHF